jgi:L-2,4-diaminobutyrate decarboxylase
LPLRAGTLALGHNHPEFGEQGTGGIPNLVTQNVLTTRRFDALKLWMSLQALGREQYGAMVERLADLALTGAALQRW